MIISSKRQVRWHSRKMSHTFNTSSRFEVNVTPGLLIYLYCPNLQVISSWNWNFGPRSIRKKDSSSSTSTSDPHFGRRARISFNRVCGKCWSNERMKCKWAKTVHQSQWTLLPEASWSPFLWAERETLLPVRCKMRHKWVVWLTQHSPKIWPKKKKVKSSYLEKSSGQVYQFLHNSRNDTKSDPQINLTRNFIQTQSVKWVLDVNIFEVG